MENNQLDVLQGGHQVGKFVASGKAITDGNYKIFVVLKACVVTAFTDTDDVNQIPLWNISGETLEAGTILFAHNSKGIKTLTLSSGNGHVLGTMD